MWIFQAVTHIFCIFGVTIFYVFHKTLRVIGLENPTFLMKNELDPSLDETAGRGVPFSARLQTRRVVDEQKAVAAARIPDPLFSVRRAE